MQQFPFPSLGRNIRICVPQGTNNYNTLLSWPSQEALGSFCGHFFQSCPAIQSQECEVLLFNGLNTIFSPFLLKKPESNGDAKKESSKDPDDGCVFILITFHGLFIYFTLIW